MSGKNDQIKIAQPRNFVWDYCLKYRPRASKQDFFQEVQYTEGALLNLLPNQTTMEYNKSQWLGKCYLVLVTISQICFALFSQQIPPLRKHLGDMTWSMFTFKVVTLGLSFYLYQQYNHKRDEQSKHKLWNLISRNYQQYLKTGDVFQLNTNIELTGNGLDDVVLDDKLYEETYGQYK